MNHEPLRALRERRSVPASQLGAPGPDAQALRQLLEVAVRVPDHGKLVPFRMILLEGEAKLAFGTRLSALLENRPGLSDAKREKERRRYQYAPLVIAVVSRVDTASSVPAIEQRLAAGNVAYNLLLGAQALGRRIEGLAPGLVPRQVLAKGNYFGYARRPAFSQLIYPAPVDGGLGIHVTLDLAGRMRFGPDVEWIDAENYDVDPGRAAMFYARIRTYWPGLPDATLVPDYAGVRPKLSGPGEPAADFVIQGPREHGLARLVNLYGIESPGLTSSLSIAEEVVARLQE